MIRSLAKRVAGALDVTVERGAFPESATPNLLGHLYRSVCFDRSSTEEFIVVQIGAHDGVSGDPIHDLIKRHHWRSVLVEPLPHVFVKLVRNYESMPFVACENAAISDVDGLATLFQVEGHEQLASLNRAVLGHHRRRIPDIDRRVRAISIPSIRPQSLLEKHKLSRVDLLQVDTEGYDYHVVRLFLDVIEPPPIIAFESKHLSRDDRLHCTRLLERNGYRWVSLHGDTIAIREAATR